MNIVPIMVETAEDASGEPVVIYGIFEPAAARVGTLRVNRVTGEMVALDLDGYPLGTWWEAGAVYREAAGYFVRVLSTLTEEGAS